MVRMVRAWLKVIIIVNRIMAIESCNGGLVIHALVWHVADTT